jgi:hypothetical protein
MNPQEAHERLERSLASFRRWAIFAWTLIWTCAALVAVVVTMVLVRWL